MFTRYQSSIGSAPLSAGRPVRTSVVSAGTLLQAQPSEAKQYDVTGESFTIPPGGAYVKAALTVDDSGTLEIRKDGAGLVLSLSAALPAGDWPNTKNPAHWHASTQEPIFLEEGTYTVSGRVTNAPMASTSENLAYFRYEVLACTEDTPDAEGDHAEEPTACNPCDCGEDAGSLTANPREKTPASPEEECGGMVEAVLPLSDEAVASAAVDDAAETPATATRMRYHSVWRWNAQLQLESGVLTIRPTAGRSLSFALTPGSAEAVPTGLTRHSDGRVELQAEDLSPCTTGSPAYWTLTEASGRRVRFRTADGTVAAVVESSGRITTAADHAAQVQEHFDADGFMTACYSAAQGLMLVSSAEDGAAVLSWYAPAQVTQDEAGNYITTGAPYKTATHRCTRSSDGSVETTTVTRQQAALPAQTITRVIDGNTVTITKGEGAEALVRRWHTTYPEIGLMQCVESRHRGSADAAPDACTCTERKLTEGGWLTLRQTEGYGSPLARTTTYEYNAQFRVSRTIRPDGGYTEHEYDAEGRVTQEVSPWGGNGLQRTRYVYAANSARFYDTRPVKVYTDYQAPGASGWLNIKVVDYTYEETDAVQRTASRTYAAGVSHQQVTVEERFGSAPTYAYAAGKPKFSRDISGVETYHEYAPTTEHGAVHLHTVITKADGALVPAQSRKTEEFIAADGTTAFEQESIWDGENWLLLSSAAYEYDAQQRVVKTTRGNGRISSSTWMCCGRLSETNEDGITTTYGYNSAHELVETIRAEVKDGEVVVTPETITTYTYDAAGRTLSTRRDIGAMTTTELTAYDMLGRVIRRTDTLGRVTSTAYSADGLTTTVTTPAGATTITQRNTDGSVARISGTAQREQLYDYEREGNNLVTTVSLPSGSVLSQSVTNGFGQVVEDFMPNTLGGFICTRHEYNARGLLMKQYRTLGAGAPTMAPTLYEYDSFGNVVKQTLALSDTPTGANSPMVEMAYSVEAAADGIYTVTTQTRYNAEGEPLTSTQKTLISQLSQRLESKTLTTDERNLTSTQWVEYHVGTKRKSYNTLPTSNITAEAVTVDGFALSQKDNAGVSTSSSRSFTASGMGIVQVDGRGNATTTATDIAGRTIRETDAAGYTTTTVYDAAHDQPVEVTDATGNTSCFRYDARGRKVAEWGTALQPACFGYDEMDNMTSLCTFRAGDETITTDPSERTDGDMTTWTFHPLTGTELSKTYADNTTVVKTYDEYNRLSTEMDARGNVKSHSYEQLRGLHIGTTYSDGTAPRQFSYNHLGQPSQVTDDAGTRTFGYNSYGERISDSLSVDGDTHLITETQDDFGRSTGYVYSKNGSAQQTVTTGYGTDGRINSAGFLHGGAEQQFSYEYMAGSHLLEKLTKSNGMTLTQSYEIQRDLLTGMSYHRGSTLVANRQYSYDSLGRPTTRNTARKGSVMNDSFTHNSRSELVEAQVNGSNYAYDYDNIGNRAAAVEDSSGVASRTEYTANELNQYTAVGDFQPQFDADGNQTLVKTTTGIWSVQYNAENRPVSFTNSASNTIVECAYDHMGRRCFKKVTTNGTVTLHQRYLYRGYLQIACIDLTRSHHPALWFITWAPTQTIATRPLAIQLNGTWYTYGWDLTKNICELYGTNGYIATDYTYSPYGAVTSSGNVTQPIQWSSEYHDVELGMVYYNYRHYNPLEGRWVGRDRKEEKKDDKLLYSYSNKPVVTFDVLGEDIYYYPFEGDIWIHSILTIDKWKIKKGKYIKAGRISYEFKPKEIRTESWWDVAWCGYIKPMALSWNIGIKGQVYNADTPEDSFNIQMATTPCYDIALRAQLEKSIDIDSTYHLIVYNCQTFAAIPVIERLRAYFTDEKPCYNPDGTIYKP